MSFIGDGPPSGWRAESSPNVVPGTWLDGSSTISRLVTSSVVFVDVIRAACAALPKDSVGTGEPMAEDARSRLRSD